MISIGNGRIETNIEKIQPDFVIANENKANENLDVVNTSSVRISQSIWPQFNPKCIE